VSATHAHLLSLPECTGAVGFCLGGTLAFLAAAGSRVDGKGIDAAISCYGSGNNGLLPMLEDVECPVLFHYGDRDPHIPAESIDEVQRAVAGRPRMRLERYDAGHAFSNWDAPLDVRRGGGSPPGRSRSRSWLSTCADAACPHWSDRGQSRKPGPGPMSARLAEALLRPREHWRLSPSAGDG
jgi:dienelactone hydrolase